MICYWSLLYGSDFWKNDKKSARCELSRRVFQVQATASGKALSKVAVFKKLNETQVDWIILNKESNNDVCDGNTGNDLFSQGALKALVDI